MDTSNVRDMGIQFDNPNYFWRCAFCTEELETVAALTTHIDTVHQTDLFKFDCVLCNFKTKGPKLLREHIAESHGDGGGPDVATTATTDTSTKNPQIQRFDTLNFPLLNPYNAQQENNDKTKTVALQTIDTPRPRNIANDGHPEVVTLDVEDMEQYAQRSLNDGHPEVVTLDVEDVEQDVQRSLLEDGLEDEALDSDGQIDEFQCRHCGIHKEVDDEIWYACPYAVFHGFSKSGRTE
jgi:hypothetical protein